MGTWTASWLGWNEPNTVVRTKTQRVAHLALLALVACIFLVDFAYLPARGEADTLFQPIYRVRQSLAVAISRLQDPPATGYTAHRSVVDSLSESGFAVFAGDPGPAYDGERTSALLVDGERVDKALQIALAAPVDLSLPAELIRGNELAYADFASLSFFLFGVNSAALYYLTFLLIGLSVFVYVLEFRRSPTMLTLLGVFLAALLYLQGYAAAVRLLQLQAVHNSRGFDALSLIAAFHIVAVACRGAPLTFWRVIRILVQAAIFAFFLASRSTILWQLAFMAGTGILLLCQVAMTKTNVSRLRRLMRHLLPLVIPAVAVAGYLGSVDAMRDEAYRDQPSVHVVWHNVLAGMLEHDRELRQEYVGSLEGTGDQLGYDAVMAYLNRTQDSTSPISFQVDGRIYIQPDKAWSEYDRLARIVATEIALNHPGNVAQGLLNKLSLQLLVYQQRSLEMSPLTQIGSAILVCLAVILGLLAGGLTPDRRSVPVSFLSLSFLAASLIPILIAVAAINVGTLMTGLVLAVMLGGFAVGGVGLLVSRSNAIPRPAEIAGRKP
jgi:hypothetical protein